jgi:hypothetical protein
MVRSDGTSAAMASTWCNRASSTATMVAPLSRSWWAKNSPLYAVLMGTVTAPHRDSPNQSTTHSGEVAIKMATRSPGPTPSPVNALAAETER